MNWPLCPPNYLTLKAAVEGLIGTNALDAYRPLAPNRCVAVVGPLTPPPPTPRRPRAPPPPPRKCRLEQALRDEDANYCIASPSSTASSPVRRVLFQGNSLGRRVAWFCLFKLV